MEEMDISLNICTGNEIGQFKKKQINSGKKRKGETLPQDSTPSPGKKHCASVNRSGNEKLGDPLKNLTGNKKSQNLVSSSDEQKFGDPLKNTTGSKMNQKPVSSSGNQKFNDPLKNMIGNKMKQKPVSSSDEQKFEDPLKNMTGSKMNQKPVNISGNQKLGDPLKNTKGNKKSQKPLNSSDKQKLGDPLKNTTGSKMNQKPVSISGNQKLGDPLKNTKGNKKSQKPLNSSDKQKLGDPLKSMTGNKMSQKSLNSSDKQKLGDPSKNTKGNKKSQKPLNSGDKQKLGVPFNTTEDKKSDVQKQNALMRGRVNNYPNMLKEKEIVFKNRGAMSRGVNETRPYCSDDSDEEANSGDDSNEGVNNRIGFHKEGNVWDNVDKGANCGIDSVEGENIEVDSDEANSEDNSDNESNSEDNSDNEANSKDNSDEEEYNNDLYSESDSSDKLIETNMKKQTKVDKGTSEGVKTKTKQRGEDKSSESLVNLVRSAQHNGTSQDVYEPPDEDVSPIVEPVFSSHLFSSTDVHPFLVSNLEQTLGIKRMTEVQRLCIPELILGKDVLVRSQTGSGKTLAYAVPLVHRLGTIVPKLSRQDGTKALVILPTRELALQTYECFLKLVKSFACLVPGYLVGGEKRKSEKARLRRGITVLVGTPGRLLDHAHNTKTLSFHSLTHLVLDEADMLLDLGYEKDVRQLMEIIDTHRSEQSRVMRVERRQTVLLSATLSPGVERLAGLAMTEPLRVDLAGSGNTVGASEILVLPETLSQHYLVCPPRLRLVTLAATLSHFIRGGSGRGKVLVFMATQDMVEFHSALLSSALPQVATYFKLHGQMTQVERSEIFKKFRSCSSGVLICTDVCARGLDVPLVDLVVQYTAPCSVADYVHRVGRTARVGKTGLAVLCLSPSESSFIDILSSKRIKVIKYDLATVLKSIFDMQLNPERELRDLEDAASYLQLKFEKAVLDENELHTLASTGYKSFIRFYAAYPRDLREVFNMRNLHLGHYAKSFALRDAPSVISGGGASGHQRRNFGANKFNKRGRPEKAYKRGEKSSSDHAAPKAFSSKSFSEYDSGISYKGKRATFT